MRVLDAPAGEQEDPGERSQAHAGADHQEAAGGHRLLAEGQRVAEVAKALEVSEWTLSRWRNQYGGMKADDAKRLKELERENARLKRMVADQALDIDMLKELARGNF